MPGAPSRRCGYYRPEGAASYSTIFPLTENPISEGGRWRNTGADWTVPQTSGGLALCTQDGLGTPSSNIYNDSYAYLPGFSANQQAEITLVVGAAITGNQECEVLLRWADDVHVARGYEVMIPRPGSSYNAQVVKWNGAYGDFIYVKDSWTTPTPQDGDIWRARIVGTTITAYLIRDGSVIWTDTADVTVDKFGTPIGVFTSGSPGIGLFRHNSGGSTNPPDFCATSFSAVGL